MEYEGKQINFKWNISIKPAGLYSSYSYMYDGIYKDPSNDNTPIKRFSIDIECGDIGMLFISYYKDNQYIFDLSKRLLKLTETALACYTIHNEDTMGYKMMYKKYIIDTNGINNPDMLSNFAKCTIFVPVLVNVKIPKGAISFGNDGGYPKTNCKYRANRGEILGVDPTWINVFRPYSDSSSKYRTGRIYLKVDDVINGVTLSVHSAFTSYSDNLGLYIRGSWDDDTDNLDCLCRAFNRCIKIVPDKDETLYSAYELDNVCYRRNIDPWCPTSISELFMHKYNVGDKIEIENFDFDPRTCSTGFHYFKTQRDALNYLWK